MARAEANDMWACDKHNNELLWHWRGDCPACADIKWYKKKLAEARRKPALLRKEVQLLRYQLKEEREKHMLTKADAAPYLVTKKEVSDLVKERL